MIAQETIDAIREQVNLSELVAEYVKLRSQGGRLVGLCPFHTEKTPSFFVRSESNSYFCFGCGASGDAISFLMHMQGISFPDAVEELAERGGVSIVRTNQDKSEGKRSNRDALFGINQLAQRFFAHNLGKADQRDREYLQKRGLSQSAIDAFGLGLVGPQSRSLTQILQKRVSDKEAVLNSGLVRRNSQGELYDTFRSRLIFPIWIDQRKIVGFGGRLLPSGEKSGPGENSPPKYLNSPETAIYRKSKTLFGIPQALEQIRRSGQVYLVEGYLDVIGLWLKGVTNVVATCGTALTTEHIGRLKSLAQRAVLLFDGDSAGRAAAGKAFQAFRNSGMDAAAVFLPQGQDPDDIARTHGEQTGEYLAGLDSLSLLDCYVRGLLEKNGVNRIEDLGAAAKGKVSLAVVSEIQQFENSIERDVLFERAAFLLCAERTSLEALSSSKKTPVLSAPQPEQDDEQGASASEEIEEVGKLPRLDQELLKAVMVLRHQGVKTVRHDPRLYGALHPSARSFLEALWQVLCETEEFSEDQKRSCARLLRSYGPSWLQIWRTAHAMQSDPSVDFMATIRQLSRGAQIRELNQLVSRIDRQIAGSQNAEDRANLNTEKLQLYRRIAQLEGSGGE